MLIFLSMKAYNTETRINFLMARRILNMEVALKSSPDLDTLLHTIASVALPQSQRDAFTLAYGDQTETWQQVAALYNRQRDSDAQVQTVRDHAVRASNRIEAIAEDDDALKKLNIYEKVEALHEKIDKT